MKVFVTGHRGYIGAHLVDVLKEAGHFVTGCDIGLFDGCEMDGCVKPDVELKKDFRQLEKKELEGHDVVMHLAAISNDPMGELNEDLTYSVNLEGSVRLAEMAKECGISRFLFSGSCSVYGKGKHLDLCETDELRPLSAYAVSKVEAEKRIAVMADNAFTPVFLRNATAYGYSPMLRIDLVVNNLLASAFAYGDIRIMSDGKPWRPLIHCRDIARAFLAFSLAPKDVVFSRSVNIGGNTENYQVLDIVNKIKKILPDANIVFTGEVGEDPRNYKVNFDLLSQILPGFKLEYDLERGVAELFDKYKRYGFSKKDFEGNKYVRLRMLKERYDIYFKKVV